MKRLFLILVVFTSCKSNTVPDINGLWIGQYSLTVQLNKVEELPNNDSIQFNEFVVEESVADSVYSIMVNILEFKSNGKVKSPNEFFKNASWTYSGDSIKLKIDTNELTGYINDSKLFLELIEGNEKVIFSLQKITESNQNTFSNIDLNGKYLKVFKQDSIISTFFFRDSMKVFIKNQYGLNTGQYGYGSYSGITGLSVFNYYTSDITGLYLFNDDKSMIIKNKELGFSKPKIDSIKYEILELLSVSENVKIKNDLRGSWISTSSLNMLTQQNRDSSMTNLIFELDILDDKLQIKFSGDETETNMHFEFKNKGIWNLSPTGDFIEFKYTKTNRGHTFEIEDYITINSITDSTLNIGYSYISLNRENRILKDRKILLIKK